MFLNRTERFLRVVRTLAFGPAARPPRLILIPESVEMLRSALVLNPRWNLEHMETIGKGAKCAGQLFKFFDKLYNVACLQRGFLRFFSNSFPNWLPEFWDLKRLMRRMQLELGTTGRAKDTVEEMLRHSQEDYYFQVYMKKRQDELEAAYDEYTNKLNLAEERINSIIGHTNDEEYLAVKDSESSMRGMHKHLAQLSGQYQATLLATEKGDKVAAQLLPSVREQLTNQKLQVSLAESRFSLLKYQIEHNQARRANQGNLPPGILSRAYMAGEARAMYLSAEVKQEVVIRDANVMSHKQLPEAQLKVFKFLKRDSVYRLEQYTVNYEESLELLSKHEAELNKYLEENIALEDSGRENFAPSQAEIEEDIRESALMQGRERVQERNGVAPAVLYDTPTRDRPLILAIARDVPAYAKNMIFKEITQAMSGVFVTLDIPDNMGINTKAMQTVIDSKKNIILMIDHGLTKRTRERFLRSFEVPNSPSKLMLNS